MSENSLKNASDLIKASPKSSSGYERLGDELLRTAPLQSYLCYENALYYCTEKDIASRLKSKLDYLGGKGYSVPKSAIVMLSYNLKNDTEACIESIRSTTPESAREIIVVDNGSLDDSIEYLEAQTDIKLRVNCENAGFPAGCNQGIRMADPDSDIFLLNNDTLLCENSLFWLRMGLYSDERNGSAGCVSNCVGNWQHAIENYQTKERYLEFAAANNLPQENALEYKAYLVGFAVLIKRKVVDLIGGLDEEFTPGFYEDNDLGLRILQAGYSNVLVHNAFIIHWGSKTFGKTNFGGRIIPVNRAVFEEKYGFSAEEIFAVDSRLEDQLSVIKDLPENARILQMDCGVGATLTYLKWKHPLFDVWGLEKNPYAASFAEKLKGVNARTYHSLKRLPLISERFDVIFMNAHEMDEKTFAEKYRTLLQFLAPSGIIVTFTDNDRYYENWLPALKGEKPAGRYNPARNNDCVSEEAVTKIINDSGCYILSWIMMYAFPVNDKDKKLVEHIAAGTELKRENDFFIKSVWMRSAKKCEDYGISRAMLFNSFGNQMTLSVMTEGSADGLEVYCEGRDEPVCRADNDAFLITLPAEFEWEKLVVKQYINTEGGRIPVSSKRVRKTGITFVKRPVVTVHVDCGAADDSAAAAVQVARTLDSLIAQTFQELEIVVTDAGPAASWYQSNYECVKTESTDTTSQVINVTAGEIFAPDWLEGMRKNGL